MVEIQTVVGMNEAVASSCKDTLIVPSEEIICLMPQPPVPVVKLLSHVEQPTVCVRETLWPGAHVVCWKHKTAGMTLMLLFLTPNSSGTFNVSFLCSFHHVF